jgi:phosphate transport system substrate-binding protein
MWRVLVALILVVSLAGCESVASVATPTPTTITIAGATAMRPLLRDLAAEFSRLHPDVIFDLRGGGSALGEEQAASGQVTLGASTLPAPSIAPPTPLRRTPIGLDGLAIVVHASNPITNLTALQLRDIFSGRVLNWRALSGDDQEMTLVSREDGSGSRRAFEERIMGDEAVSLTAVVMPTSQAVMDYVASHPAAIGYVSRAYVVDQLAGEVDSPASVRVVAVEGQKPTLENLRNQGYYLMQPLYLLSVEAPRGRVRQFVDFALSPAGQQIMARYHAPVR